ncbi:hypothetical protein HAV15_012742 [Penicillium sp. str. |nr:hypothetical protein HAV15_012742 [Penicillium sp. str. \
MSNENPIQAESALLSRRRRRKSLPSRNGTDPTSPEVISSLISSLSTISVPLNSHFDTVPKFDTESDPALPEVPHTAPINSLPPSEQHGFGMSYGAYKPAVEPPVLPDNPFLHPDDAASSPVIRMARAPPVTKVPSIAEIQAFQNDRLILHSPSLEGILYICDGRPRVFLIRNDQHRAWSPPVNPEHCFE